MSLELYIVPLVCTSYVKLIDLTTLFVCISFVNVYFFIISLVFMENIFIIKSMLFMHSLSYFCSNASVYYVCYLVLFLSKYNFWAFIAVIYIFKA